MKKIARVSILILGVIVVVVALLLVGVGIQDQRYAKFNVQNSQSLYRCVDSNQNVLYTTRPIAAEFGGGFGGARDYYNDQGRLIMSVNDIDYPGLKLNGKNVSCVVTRYNGTVPASEECGQSSLGLECGDSPVYMNFRSLDQRLQFWLREVRSH